MLIAALLLTVSAAWLGASGSQDDPDPLPFDPLSTHEQENAVRIAREDPQIALTLSDRHEVIGAALNTDKDRLRADMDSRHADVWIYDYTHHVTIRAVVDLDEQTVESISRTKDQQPPLTASEMERAGELALANKDVQDELEDRSPYETLQPLARLWTDAPPEPCSTNRCALVTFLLDGDYAGDLFVLVDLSREQVDHVVEPDPGHAHKEVAQ